MTQRNALQNSSSTTGPLQPTKLPKEIGALLGEHGFAGKLTNAAVARLEVAKTSQDSQLTQQQRAQVDKWLAAAFALPSNHGEMVAARIDAFLHHWYDPTMTTESRALLISDWVEAFDNVPMWSIEDAIATWLKTRDIKPSPRQFRTLCLGVDQIQMTPASVVADVDDAYFKAFGRKRGE